MPRDFDRKADGEMSNDWARAKQEAEERLAEFENSGKPLDTQTRACIVARYVEFLQHKEKNAKSVDTGVFSAKVGQLALEYNFNQLCVRVDELIGAEQRRDLLGSAV